MTYSLFNDYILNPHHFSGPGLALVILALLVVLAFELWMLIDVLTYRKVPKQHKLWWVLGMFVIHPFVAIVYFFVRPAYKRAKLGS